MPFGFLRRTSAPQPDVPDDAPGWDALDRALAEAIPAGLAKHWSTDHLPGQEGPYAINVFRDGDEWLYVTYGLSDLFGTFERDPEAALDPEEPRWSGFGLELTMRVRDSDPDPPEWPLTLLNQLGEYVYKSGRVFEHGHRMDAGQPITGGTPPTRLTAVLFANDPVLGTIDSAFGRVDLIEAIGATEAELQRAKAGTTDQVLAELAIDNPRLATRPDR
jgi:hypothetical protein